MDLTQPVSGRQFAKMVGQTEGAVRKAAARSSIVAGITPEGKYLPLVASEEWGKPILPEFSGIPVAYKKPKASGPAKPKKEIDSFNADDIVKDIMNEPGQKIDPGVDLDKEDLEGELDEKMNKPEAERITAIMKAKMLQLALMEKQRVLIPKEKIGPVLFSFGQELRFLIEGLSNKVTDRIIAADDRNEAKNILDEEVHLILSSISDVTTRSV